MPSASTASIPLTTMSPHPEIPMRDQVKSYIYTLQSQIVHALESIPDPFLPSGSGVAPLRFNKREWTREEGGGGIAFTTPASPASLLNVNVSGGTGGDGVGGSEGEVGGWLEKGCVNVSMIDGMLSPPAIRQMSTEHAELRDEELSKCVPLSIAYHNLHGYSNRGCDRFRQMST